MHRFFFTLLSILILSILHLSAQHSLSGEILDKKDMSPIEYANVTLMKPDSSYVTGTNSDESGYFILNNLEKKDYLLSIKYIGYKTVYLSINKYESINLGKIYIEPDAIALKDVTITAQSVINKTDRKLIMPSESQVKASTNGIDLLQKLQLPRLTFDFLSNSVVMAGKGTLQLRINGIEVTNAEIVALRPDEIIRIEYHDQPGARYGNADAIIDYITKRKESGGNINGNGMNVLAKQIFSENNFSAKINHKKSEFSANTYWSGRKFNWTRQNDETFRFPNNDILERSEEGLPTKFKSDHLHSTVNYSLVDKDKYYFNARFRYNYWTQPNSYTDRKSTLTTSDNPIPLHIYDHESQKHNIPALDLYYSHNLKNNQLLIFNIVGTYITSNNNRQYQEMREENPVTDIYSKIKGNKYSLITEGIYEKGFSAGKLTAGLKHNQSYTHNVYSGNSSANINMITAETYAYTEYQWKKNKLSYTANIGVMRTYYRQGNENQDRYTFRPSFSTTYNINDHTFIRARTYIWGGNPSLGDLNNVEQAVDSLQIRRGNPNLKSYLDYGGNIAFGYNKGIIGIDVYAQYKYLRKPVMESIIFEDGFFVRLPENQKSYQHFSTEATIKIRPLKEYITISLTPGINYYKSHGHTYKHTYTNPYFRINIDAMYKNFIMNFWATTANDWFYGEAMYQGEAFQTFALGYKQPNYSIMLGAMNPWGMDYKTKNESWSNLYSSKSQLVGDNLTPLFFVRFSFNINFGRQFNGNGRRLNNTDTDSGLMTGSKK